MTDRRDLAGHLELYAQLGVNGVSSDPAWRRRAAGPGATGAESPETGAPVEAGGPAAEAGHAGDEATPPGPADDPAAALVTLREHIGDCTRCKLHEQGRTQVVFGVGNPNARLMFVGEAPGADEDRQGEPFVGRAGQLLTKIIEAIELRREDVYIANVIKCRPPGNRNPQPDEVATCEPFLYSQIDTIRPEVIVALGSHAAHALLKTDEPISRLRGRWFDYRGGSKLIPTFHPAFLLRSPNRKRDVWEDMKKVRAVLSERD